MALFKCKMCGGTLGINNETVATCEYCGTQQTIPKLSDDRRANLYDRANHFRRNNEFDKAMGIYEQILNDDNTDAESYWSLVLCRYGIEYVEDPTTHKRVPTVNRAQFTSIFDDDNYRSALQYADSEQRGIYQKEACTINEIQKGILAISQKEEPFDVFICYKETDRNGRRTPDSVLANDLYHQLTQEGFKVFFSRITLEDKLGVAYEPYIFAALNSAKVMVVLGTKPEYFNAVWVKNEWSRYLSLIKGGAKKILIPAYRDMDPYDLPEEFSHLQAQDMSKLGFIQDLIRGIKKLTQTDTTKQTVTKETVVASGSISIGPLLKRAYMFLEDEDWGSATEYCEKVLDIDPENAYAYLGKLMSELHVQNHKSLLNCKEPFDNMGNYQKAIRFADDKLKMLLTAYVEKINDRNEAARCTSVYKSACALMTSAEQNEAIYHYQSALKKFESIPEWEDSQTRINICKREIQRIEKKEAARSKRITSVAVIIAIITFVIITFVTVLNRVVIPNNKYNDAVALMEAGQYEEAIAAFEALDGHKDSGEKVKEIYREYILKPANVGDYVTFGRYEQDNDTTNGTEKIEWLVLDKQDGKLLVISKKAIDCKPYDSYSSYGITWGTCALREWLNNDFIDAAFSTNEKVMIPWMTNSADENPEYGTDPGVSRTDKVFLLSITEAKKYFNSDSERKCTPTEYAIAQGVFTACNGASCYWWLRTPGNDRHHAATCNGDFFEYGDVVWDDEVAVRPAMWIDLNVIN